MMHWPRLLILNERMSHCEGSGRGSRGSTADQIQCFMPCVALLPLQPHATPRTLADFSDHPFRGPTCTSITSVVKIALYEFLTACVR